MKIAMLTGGGDSSGLNPDIRGTVKYSINKYQDIIIGIRYGWRGIIDTGVPLEERIKILTLDSVSGILNKGGTILGSSRTNPLRKEGGLINLKKSFEALNVDALIAIGGEDTLGVAYEAFVKENIPIVGVPKTIDNDLFGTENCIGFTTACDVATEAIDRLHSTAESHDRLMVVEVMGRHTGWIALRAGVAGGADVILIPEFPLEVDYICELIYKRQRRGKKFSIVVIAEGYPLEGRGLVASSERDAFGHERLGGVGERLASLLEKHTGFETRSVNLGHVQRGGTPSTYDRWLGTNFGIKSIELVHEGAFGQMVAIQSNQFTSIDLKVAVSKLRTVPEEEYKKYTYLFG